eukprot:3600108-Pleurochrysis_carterae.AAC.1
MAEVCTTSIGTGENDVSIGGGCVVDADFAAMGRNSERVYHQAPPSCLGPPFCKLVPPCISFNH